MKKQKMFEKFENSNFDLGKIKGGRLNTEGTGDCAGTGCSESSGNGIIDWADVECGDETVAGSVKCPA
ncbi:MAG: hypothetical protein H6586_03900 [Flavobacteriales bacterium]|nr:hypothetical protein [Flavobacteriales bacterium]